MKWRYYLRGLSAGIIITALIITIGGKKQETVLSDKEIRQRAEQLGMVDKGNLILSDLKDAQEEKNKNDTKTEDTDTETEETNTDTETKGTNIETEETDTETKETNTETKETNNKTETQETESKPTSSKQPETESSESLTEDKVEITITRGENSLEVSKALQEAGLIEDAENFDYYLISNGYSRFITAGIHEIPVGTSEEDIAQIIMKKPKTRLP